VNSQEFDAKVLEVMNLCTGMTVMQLEELIGEIQDLQVAQEESEENQ
jgi:hypothetical protein